MPFKSENKDIKDFKTFKNVQEFLILRSSILKYDIKHKTTDKNRPFKTTTHPTASSLIVREADKRREKGEYAKHTADTKGMMSTPPQIKRKAYPA